MPGITKYVRGFEHLKILNTSENRFYCKVNKVNKNGCMLWNAFKNPSGYGMFRTDIMRLAHRYAYQLYFGEIPKGMHVLHKCDVRSCVAPKHLFLGTQKDNIKDMLKKGRHRAPKGNKHWSAKLTNTKVKNIKLKMSQGIGVTKISRLYNVHITTIERIKANKTWSHI